MSTTMSTISILILLIMTPFMIQPTLQSLYKPPPPQILSYHHGPLLDGNIPLSILWYGHFSPTQKSIITDFLLSLSFKHHLSNSAPSVSKWWHTVDKYLQKARKSPNTHIYISSQISDPNCSLGNSLTHPQLATLAAKIGRLRNTRSLSLILTAEDVAVEAFCMSACGLHSCYRNHMQPYVWVGNSETQCPGQCAWPFHEPMFGPRGPALRSPNGDVGVDGMIINLGTLLAGAVTNPFGDGFYMGEEKVEVVGACAGVYGWGAYPGYAGEVRVDEMSGGSYNVVGVRGRKYLVPAMFDPDTFSCLPA